MKFRSILMLTSSLMAFSSLANKNIEPKLVSVTYGNSSISTEIDEGKAFSTVLENDEEMIKLSGLVTRGYRDFVVDITIVRRNKHRNSQINTSIIVKENELGIPLFIGGSENEIARLTLQAQDN
ncbi:hypothetical protein [Vibrio caribbeanicus]|uniref:hypothetical protein n=1 Tax=Vibrio caribbeanicus TaxID=701175 RepID=UPI0030DD7F7C